MAPYTKILALEDSQISRHVHDFMARSHTTSLQETSREPVLDTCRDLQINRVLTMIPQMHFPESLVWTGRFNENYSINVSTLRGVSFGLPPKCVLFKEPKPTHLSVAHSTDLRSGNLARVEGKLTNILTLLISTVPSQALSVSFEV